MHEVTMIVGIKSMKYDPKFPNFMGVAREIYCVLSMNMGMYMPKNHELIYALINLCEP